MVNRIACYYAPEPKKPSADDDTAKAAVVTALVLTLLLFPGFACVFEFLRFPQPEGDLAAVLTAAVTAYHMTSAILSSPLMRPMVLPLARRVVRFLSWPSHQ